MKLFLKDAERTGQAWLRRSTACLLADTVAAVGFAAGLAEALSAVSGQVDAALPWLLLAAGSAGLRGAAAMAAARCGARASGAVRQGLRRQAVAGALAGGMDGRATGGGLMHTAVDGVDAFDAYLARFVPARRTAAVAPLLVLAAVAGASWVSALVLLGTLVPFGVLMAFAGVASADESDRQFRALQRLSGLFADRLRALPVVLAFQAQVLEADRLQGAAQEVAHRTLRVLRLAFMSSAVLEFFAALGVALVAVYAGFQLLGLLPFRVPEQLDLGQAFFALALAPEFYAPMRRLAAAYHDRQAALTAAERLAPLLDAADRSSAAAAAANKAWIGGPADGAPSLRFENITIQYPGQAAPAVQGLSFTVGAGRTVAILGPTGSGKTSLLRLLLGIAPLVEGQVLVGNRPLPDGEGIAAQAAWVGQHPLIVPGTLHDNLVLAWPGASQALLADAVAVAGLAPLLARRGLDLQSRVDARGSGLSGGERRRLALARAVLKPARVWLLDEPTAHLDEASEAGLIASIARASRGRTTLIATHSEKLAAIADVVIRLERSA